MNTGLFITAKASHADRDASIKSDIGELSIVVGLTWTIKTMLDHCWVPMLTALPTAAQIAMIKINPFMHTRSHFQVGCKLYMLHVTQAAMLVPKLCN